MRRILCVLIVLALSTSTSAYRIDTLARRQKMQHLELTVGQNLVRRGAAGMGIEDHDVDQLRIDEPSATGELANGGKQDVGSLSFVT